MNSEEQILDNAETLFAKAVQGYRNYQHADGEKKIHGIFDVPTYGRATTRTLQQLRSIDVGFDEWWAPRRQVLEDDPVCKYIWNLRNKILKEGEGSFSNVLEIDHLNSSDIPQPPWADGTFISDEYGGDGFIIKGPDGEETKIYSDLGLEGVNSYQVFSDLREDFDPETYPTSSVEKSLAYYLKIIGEIVTDAKDRFGQS